MTGRSKRTRPAQPEDHPQAEDDPMDDVLCCDNCSDALDKQSYAQLSGECNHNLCFFCFGEAHAARSVLFKMSCPCRGCNNRTREWNIITYTAGATRQSQPRHQAPRQQQITPPCDRSFLGTHPNLYHQHQPRDYKKKYNVLSLAAYSTQNERTQTYSVELSVTGDTHEASEQTLQTLNAIGRSLSPCILPRCDNKAKSNNTYGAMTSIAELEKLDSSPLRLFIHGLAGSSFDRNANAGRDAYTQREYNMSYAASEIVRSLKGGGVKHASKLKDFISDNLTVAGVTDAVKNLFSSIGMSRSRNYFSLAQDKAVEEKIKQGWSPKGRGFGFIVGVYDNMGFRRKIGFVQFTMMAILFFSVYDLIKLKIYPDPKKKNDIAAAKSECHSWVGLDWEEFKDSYNFVIEEKDAETLASQVTIPMIQFVLEAFKDGILPSYDDSKQVMDGNEMSFSASVTRRVSGRRSMAPPNVSSEDEEVEIGNASTDIYETPVEESDISNIDDLDEEHDERPTIYSRNNATIDLSWKADLNALSTVKGIVNYFHDIKDRCLECTLRPCHDSEDGEVCAVGDDEEADVTGNPWADAGWEVKDWPTPWMSHHGVALCGDGQPTFAMLRLKRDDDDYKDKEFQPFNGGFHTMLETHKLRGKMFGPAHLREIWTHWRKTKAQLDWVMTPGDPNQVEDEMAMYYIGAIASAIKALVDHRIAENVSTDICALDVFTFMQESAQRSPIAQSIYNELRFAEVVFLLQLAEEKADAAMFVTGMKFACLLYTTNHASKYTEISAEFLKWWYCASPAEKVIFEKIIMTRKTKANKTIYTDRFVEWMIKDLRGGVGKHYRRGTDAALRRKASLLTLEKEFHESFNTPSKRGSKEGASKRKVGASFCYTYVYLTEEQVWKASGDTNLQRHSIKGDKPDINIQLIDAPCTGERRMDSYIKALFVEDEADNDDEMKVSEVLRAIQPTLERQNEDDRLPCVSTTVDFVEQSYIATELKKSYREEVVGFWGASADRVETYGPMPKVGGRKNKKDYAEALCEARKIFIEKVSFWERDTKSNLQQQINERDAELNNQIKQRMDSIKDSWFFKLLSPTNALRSNEVYTKALVVESTPAPQDPSQDEEDYSFMDGIVASDCI